MIVLASAILSSVPLSIHNKSSKVKISDNFSAFNSAIPKDNVVKRRCEFYDLHKGLVPYAEAWSWQKNVVKERKLLDGRGEDISDTLIMLQHHPVYTLGTGSSEAYLNFDVNNAPFNLYRTERGGEVTYHGPGQVVMYPIINLRYHMMDLHWYLRALEEVIIRALYATFSIKASRVDGLTGVWFGDKKLAAIGIKVSQWITYHGVALNVTNDMSPFHQIVPCGIRDRQVGNVKEVLQDFVSSNEREAENKYQHTDKALIEIACKSLVQEFCEVFQVDLYRGHTAEMLNLLTVLEKDRFQPRHYIAAATDNMSLQKAQVFENSLHQGEIEAVGTAQFLQIYRSREAGQSYLTSVGTTLIALAHALWLMIKIRPEVILCNGPGTCVPLCVIAFLFKVFGIRWSRALQE